MTNHPNRSSGRRLGAAITVAALAGGGFAASAQASEIQRAYAEHTGTCLGLLFTDSAAHFEQCLPNNSPASFFQDDSGIHTPAVPVPPPVAVVVPPPPPPPVIVLPTVEEEEEDEDEDQCPPCFAPCNPT